MNPDLQAQTDRILEAAAQLHADLHALYWLGVTGTGLLFLILLVLLITRRQ
jgi:hypothetical protein